MKSALVAGFTEPGWDNVKVSGTRRCTRKDVAQKDKRRLCPIGLLFQFGGSESAGLFWVEILVLIMYTGPMLVLYNGIHGALKSRPAFLGKLAAPETLRLRGCEALESLPESFGKLAALQILNLRGCQALESPPESFGKLAALERLDLVAARP